MAAGISSGDTVGPDIWAHTGEAPEAIRRVAAARRANCLIERVLLREERGLDFDRDKGLRLPFVSPITAKRLAFPDIRSHLQTYADRHHRHFLRRHRYFRDAPSLHGKRRADGP